jgi:hypothetical protein
MKNLTLIIDKITKDLSTIGNFNEIKIYNQLLYKVKSIALKYSYRKLLSISPDDILDLIKKLYTNNENDNINSKTEYYYVKIGELLNVSELRKQIDDVIIE